MKKQIPILFSTPMVKSIDVDIKTQTRRTKGLEWINTTIGSDYFIYDGICNDDSNYHYFEQLVDGEPSESYKKIKCPYGQVGDLLWVRETFKKLKKGSSLYEYVFKANYFNTDTKGWKPSIHMPKLATRTWLEISNIKIERLKEISNTDSESEGILKYPLPEKPYLYVFKDYEDKENYFQRPDYSFRSLWRSINGKESWAQNPFVWVITFKKVAKP